MITAIILAAGQSKRMGRPKMLLPWGETTVLEKVIATFKATEIDDILVVTGGERQQVEALVKGSARTVYNPDYAQGDMLSSVQTGLAELRDPSSKSALGNDKFDSALTSGFKGGWDEVEAVLIGLGDQPQVEERSVRLVIDEYRTSGGSIVVPSFQMRRGHPWLVTREHWGEILALRSPASLRDFLNTHANEIHYVEVNNDSILQDLDTPEDYLKFRP